MNMVFVDASAWIALYHKRDKYHRAAWIIYEQCLNESKKFFTTNWVAYEAMTLLKSRSSYRAARALWDIFQDTELSQLTYIDRELENAAVDLFWKFRDKKWGIVDCSSMLLMEKENCSVAFGYDHHFVEAGRQYGFTLL
ncbi:MAG: type II toxin-antitoxin system VapC family toxin [Deltaproteobacteria bacterium]|nr:type II toxin-antitoxin system VapC family toxin [Deltaproteobacteria bacterium]